jgi:hypothetical protein
MDTLLPVASLTALRADQERQAGGQIQGVHMLSAVSQPVSKTNSLAGWLAGGVAPACCT